MSSIPVTMDIILQKDEALEQFQAFARETQATVAQMQSIQVNIPVIADTSGIQSQLDSVRENISSQPAIQLPTMLDTSGIAAQLAEVREMAASQPPITIPVQYVPVGGAGAAAGSAAGGIAAGVGGVVGGAAAGAIFGPEGAAAGAIEGLEAEGGAAAGAGAIEEGLGMEAGSLAPTEEEGIQSEADSLYNKALRRRPGAPTPSRHWYQYSGMGRHAWLGGYVAWKGLSELTGKLTQQDFQDKINSEPDLAKQLDEERAQVEKDNEGWLAGTKHAIWRSAPGNWLGKEIWGKDFHEESADEARGHMADAERTMHYEKERDAAFKKNMPEIASLRGELAESNDELSGITGSSNDRIRAGFKKQYEAVMKQTEKALDSVKNNEPGADKVRELAHNLQASVLKIYNSHIAVLDQQADQEKNSMVLEGRVAQLRASGDEAGARKLELSGDLENTYNRLKKDNPVLAEYFRTNVDPAERATFERDEKHRAYDEAAENRFTEHAAADRADRTRAEMNHDPVAAATAANKEIDDHVKLLKDEAENERLYGDAEKAKSLATKAAAAEAEGAAEKIKNMADAMKEAAARASEVARSVRDINGEAEDERLRADGKGWTADKNAAQRKYRDAFDAVEDDPKLNFAQKQEKEAALGKLMSADEYAIEKKRQKEMRDIGEDTLKYEWRSKNRPQMGELSEIEFKTIESLREHTDDPVYQMKIRNEGAAELTAFAHPDEKSEWYSSAADYAKALNTGTLNQDQEASKEALEAAKILKESGLKWEKVADQLLNSQPFHIVKNGY